MCRILSLLVLLIGASCSELTRTKEELTQNAQVYAEDASPAQRPVTELIIIANVMLQFLRPPGFERSSPL